MGYTKENFIKKLNNKDLFMRIIPDSLLYQKTDPINTFDNDLKNIISDMKIFMTEYSGVGLAGNQIGFMKNIITIMPSEDEFLSLINPQIISQSNEKCDMEEGCLSIPDVYYSVSRSNAITVKYQNEDGEEKIKDFDGIKARIILHEVDHLNGILFIDHLSRLKKSMVERKFKKLANR